MASSKLFRGTLGVVLMLAWVTAEAGLIRGGGRGSASVIGDPDERPGTVPFLVSDSLVGSAVETTDSRGTVSSISVTSGELDNSPAYGFGDSGAPISIEHDYGSDCVPALDKCTFELAESEIFSWKANLLGLPDVDSDGYAATADLVITWDIFAADPPDPINGLIQIGAMPIYTPLLSWSTTFAADPAGFYSEKAGSSTKTTFDAGTGNTVLAAPVMALGPDLGFTPATDGLSGCFATNPNSPATSDYSRGSCRQVTFDLALDGDTPTGADLNSLLSPFASDSFLALQVSAELLAPDGFQFANFAPENTLSFDGDPDFLRNADTVIYRECASFGTPDCERAISRSDYFQINVVADVPATPTFWLILIGTLPILRARARGRRDRRALA